MNDIVKTNMHLLGLKMPYGDYFCSYFEQLPESFTKCLDFRDFYKLKKNKRKFTKNNIKMVIGMEYILYSRTSNKYYYKKIFSFTNTNRLFKYFRDGNIYILKELVPEIKKEKILDETNSLVY